MTAEKEISRAKWLSRRRMAVGISQHIDLNYSMLVFIHL